MKQQKDYSLLLVIIIIAFAVFVSSCSSNLTPQQAANGKARCGMGLK